MRRSFAGLLFGVFLATSVWPALQPSAQDHETAQQQSAAEFVQLWLRFQLAEDGGERIALAEQALRLEPELRQWPLALTREEVRGRLWWRLGLDYAEGDRSIAAYEQALQIFTREKSARHWASLKKSLGVAFWGRSLEQADNEERAIAHEKAIAHFEEALKVFMHETMPREWAEAQDYLGWVYLGRIRGEHADNLEKAIAHFEEALSARTHEELPRERWNTQIILAQTYQSRMRGDHADNLDKALAIFEEALSVRTREALPHSWADTQNHLAYAYQTRIRGDRADNVEKAIAAYEAALTVRTREALPFQWARTQDNFATVYLDRVRGDRADNVEKAIAHLEAALTVFASNDGTSLFWAMTQYRLGNAFQVRIRDEPADNMEKAIAAYEAAFSVSTRETSPLQWADVQSSLGTAYRNRILGERAGNLERAIAAYEAALTIITRQAWPRHHLQTGRLLGAALLEAKDWRNAGLAYASAREAFLLLFGQGLNDAEARDLITAAGPLFAEAAFAAAQRGESEAALALAVEGRARLMAIALKLQTLEFPADKRRRLDELRVAIRTEQRATETMQGIKRAAALEKLIQLRQELLGLVNDAAPAEGTSGPALAQAGALVGAGGAVVVPILTKVGAKILIVTAAGNVQNLTVLDLPELTTDRLNKLTRGDGRSSGWFGAYNITYLQGAELERRWPEWLAAVGNLGPELWLLFGERLDRALKERDIKRGARLVWLPSGALGILPLGLAQNPTSKRRLADDYEIVYAPSLQALVSAQARIANVETATLAAIINPTEDLLGTEKEGKLVASYFADKNRSVLERGAATPEAVLAALKGKTHWHFASHGTFSWEDARQSALVMHGWAPLSVGRLLETDGLGQPRLVVLSACETGLYDIASNPDEFIGLPGTFTALGGAAVIGTLWPVSDAATALLMAKFYELHMGQRLPPSTALSRAQAWLRQATNIDLLSYARVVARHGRIARRDMAEIEQELSEEGLKRSRNKAAIEWRQRHAAPHGGKGSDSAARLVRPYRHPYFWAGFTNTGL